MKKSPFMLPSLLILLVVTIRSWAVEKPGSQGRDGNPCLQEVSRKVSAEEAGVKQYGVIELGRIRHEGRYRFTEGLEFHAGYLYEGTGTNFGTALKKIDPADGKVIVEKKTSALFHNLHFGEGITILADQVIQLSYHNHKAYVFDLNNFIKRKTFSYSGQGWGLTKNRKCFIMSNGSSEITFRDFRDFSVKYRLRVTQDGKEVTGMNELEYANGIIYANIFPKDYIVMIDPFDGKVVGRIDGSGLECSHMMGKQNVLNGIAYDASEGVFYLTGKNCEFIYKATFGPQ